MIVKLLTEHHLEFLNLTGGCRGSSESTHVKMPHCWLSHALAHIVLEPSIHLSIFLLSSRTARILHYFYIGVCSDVNNACIVTEYCSRRSFAVKVPCNLFGHLI